MSSRSADRYCTPEKPESVAVRRTLPPYKRRGHTRPICGRPPSCCWSAWRRAWRLALRRTTGAHICTYRPGCILPKKVGSCAISSRAAGAPLLSAVRSLPYPRELREDPPHQPLAATAEVALLQSASQALGRPERQLKLCAVCALSIRRDILQMRRPLGAQVSGSRVARPCSEHVGTPS